MQTVGRLNSSAVRFGPNNHLEIFACRTRFDRLEWFVHDHNSTDLVTGEPECVIQTSTWEDAVSQAFELYNVYVVTN